MKTIAACTLALALALPTLAFADTTTAPSAPAASPGIVVTQHYFHATMGDPKAAANAHIQQLERTIQLTDEQKQAITSLFENQKVAIDKFAAESGPKLEAAAKAVNDAYKTQDQDAIARAQDDFNRINEPQAKLIKKFGDDLKKVLTRSQKAALQDANLRMTIKLYTDPAELKESQIKQLKEAFTNPIPGQTFEQALDAILTPQQKNIIAANQAKRYVKAVFAPIDFTPDQQKQVDEIVAAVEKDPNLQGTEMHNALYQKILPLLTDEQLDAVRKGRRPRPSAPKQAP
jgi:Spy/CpxP family protein refolding chaperone